MEFPSKKFIIVRDKSGAAVLTSPTIYNTIEDARTALKSIASEQFGSESGWVATWCPGDKVEFSIEGLPEKLVYVIQEMDLNDVYNVVVNIPMWTQVKASSWEDAKEKAVAEAYGIIRSEKIKDALAKAGLDIREGMWNTLPITVACENAEVKE